MTAARYLLVDADLAGFEQYLELERGEDGAWRVTRQIDAHADGWRRYGRGATVVDERGMLSDRPSTEAELTDDEFSTPIPAAVFLEKWDAASPHHNGG